jgi:hypothetical protein
MAASGGNMDMIARFQRHGFALPFEFQHGAAAQHHDPFVPILIVPKSRRGSVTGGQDAFDAQVSRRHQRREQFVRQ